MKKLLGGLIVLLLMLVTPASAEEVSTGAKACIVMDMESGRVLLSHNAETPLPMASTTKIMTILLALENAAMDEAVTAGRNAFGVPGTSIYLDLGETLTMEQMLYGLMLASGNDAAVAIAEHIGGTVEDFCARMTQRAAEIGCTNTVFLTPHGLPQEGHYTTAHDLALITREAMQLSKFREIVSTQRATIPWKGREYDRVLKNKNRLLAEYDGAIGVKTGYTRAAGRCLVTAAERDGMAVICVVLNCYDWFNESARLLDMAFDRWENFTLLSTDESIREVPVENSGGAVCSIMVGDELHGLIPKGSIPSLEIDIPDTLIAPVNAGDIVGKARMLVRGEIVASVPLVAADDIDERTFHAGLQHIISLWE